MVMDNSKVFPKFNIKVYLLSSVCSSRVRKGHVDDALLKVRHQPIRPHRACMKLRFLDDQDYRPALRLVPRLFLFKGSSVIQLILMSFFGTFAKKQSSGRGMGEDMASDRF